MRLITDQPEIVARFVATGLKRTIWPPYTALGWVLEQGDNWRLVGGVVFNDFNGHNIEASVHWNGPITRQPIRDVMHYVFEQCKCGRLTVKTERQNARVRKILPRMGFQIEAELRRFYGPRKGQNALLFRMEPATAYRWINGINPEPPAGPDAGKPIAQPEHGIREHQL